jgi:hypothetical protein
MPTPPRPTSSRSAAGEFQFAFLAFLLGHSMEGFAQWKAFLCLMFGCDDAPLGARQPLFARFLRALHAQLVQGLAPVSVCVFFGGGGGGGAALVSRALGVRHAQHTRPSRKVC